MILAGDVGGTKTSIAVFSSKRNLRKPLAQKTFSSPRFRDIESLLFEFLSKNKYSIDQACFAVAGPVIGGKSSITNLPWVISERQIKRVLGISSVLLINDLVATASFVPFLNPNVDYLVLNKGRPVQHGTIAVIAPGTGLGEAFLIWDGKKYRAFASEGGHSDFAPRDVLQIELLKYMLQKLDHVSYERVCSGPGLKEIHTFYHKIVDARERHAELSKIITEADDPVPIIVKAALGGGRCDLCEKSLDTFVAIMGAEASNLALKIFATNAVYIAGGIPPRIRSALEDGKFVEAITKKGRQSELLADIPVYLVLNPDVCLLGAAKLGFEKFSEKGEDRRVHARHFR
jgi:glucokinase